MTPSSKGTSWLTAAVLLAALVAFGVIAGGLVATRVLSTSEMGWDQIADTLGGLMVGSLMALAAWVVAVRTLGSTGRMVLTGTAIAGCLFAILYLRSTPVNVRVGNPADIPAPPVEPFTFRLSTADGLAGPSPVNERLPWQFLRIASNLSFDYVPVDRPSQQCIANSVLDTPDGIAALTNLRTTLAALPAEVDCGEPCPACSEVGLEWNLDQDRSTLMVTDRCWDTHEQLQPLRASVESILATYGGQVVCESSGQ